YESTEDIDKTIEILEYISTIKQDVDILNRIGILYKKNGNFEKAIEYFNYIIEIDSQNVDAWLQKAIIFKHFDKKTALEIFEHLENIDPSNNMITFNKYLLLLEMYKYNEALETAFKMLESEPENYFYYCLCAEIYLGLEQYDKSAEYYEKSFKYSPLNQMAMVGLAGIYSIKGDFQKAKNLIESIPEENKSGSDDPEYMYYYIHMRNKQFDEVKETFFKNHLKIKNTKEKDEQARGLFYKLDIGGNYNISEEGFAIFRKNLNEESDLFYKNCMKKRWKDEDITGKTLLLYSINGAGDIIMFSRYINDIKDKAGKIIMLLPESFKELYTTSFKDIEIHTDYKEINLDEIDYTSSYMLLLYTAKADLKNIKYSQGYLTVSKNSVKEKSKYDFINTNKKKIGIFWQGNPSILQNRSIKLKYFIPIIELDNVQLYSFQISNVDFESDRLKNELKIIDLAPYIKSYNDTAAFLKNMDLLITIDTSIANLAGALGIPTYLLLPYATEWRWFYDTDSTPWYDSIKIFKQKKPNDWEEVITRVKNGLRL
ncbi:MAG: tetratricopeptide repeat protein, partial [Candidatus Gastranaerophilales bacterium]|nr:tetratricopeptide repeat protein [Candidatus Gastranaerophilales bacterium]